jgi:hypothetical protein
VHGGGSEFFRTEHRHREVNEQGEGDEPDEDGFHGFQLEGCAAVGVKPADDEEGGGDAEEDEVVHSGSMFVERQAERELKHGLEASKLR